METKIEHFRKIVKSIYPDMKVVDITNMPKKIHNKFIDKTQEDRSLICFSEFALFPNGIHFVPHILFNKKTIQFDIDISDRLLIKRLQNIVDCETSTNVRYVLIIREMASDV